MERGIPEGDQATGGALEDGKSVRYNNFEN